jgi:hypothetical protein
MTNDFIAGMLAGVAIPITGLIIFQIGLNIGVRNVLNLIQGEYPAAYRFLDRNKKAANVIPYIVANQGNE